MRLYQLIEFLLRRHLHRTVQFHDAAVLTPAQQTAYHLDTLIQILIVDVRQLTAILCQDSPHAHIERNVDPLLRLGLLEIDVFLPIAEGAEHIFIDALENI